MNSEGFFFFACSSPDNCFKAQGWNFLAANQTGKKWLIKKKGSTSAK